MRGSHSGAGNDARISVVLRVVPAKIRRQAMYLSRRKFLATLTGGSAVISLGGQVPAFLAQAAAAETASGKDTILVVVQLTGGNDGLNTVVPYNHDGYRKARPKLAIAAGDILKIDD